MFANCRSRFLLDRLRSSRCLKLFVSPESTPYHEFASQFGLAIFYTRKTPKTCGNRVARPPAPVEKASWLDASDPSNSDNLNGDGGGWLCACVTVCVCVIMCLQYTIIIMSPRLIMIIIKIIILYFIQITHTDDFPSMGTRLVVHNN